LGQKARLLPLIATFSFLLAYLVAAALLFAVGQVFQFVISTHICNGTNGAIDGSLFQTLFNILAVAMLWVFWQSITEENWALPMSVTAPGANHH
jgi:hypothetical protein